MIADIADIADIVAIATIVATVVNSNYASNGEQNQYAFILVQFGLFGLDFAVAALNLYGRYSFVRVESDQWQNHRADRNDCQDR